MQRVVIFTTAVLLLLNGTSSAQQPSPAQVDPQAATVMGGCLSAMGASGYSQGLLVTPSGTTVQDSLSMGTITLWDGTSGSITTKTKGLGLSRTDTNINGNQTTIVTNNGSGHISQGGTDSRLPIWVTKYWRSRYIPVLSRITDYSQPTTNLTYVGLETMAGASVHHIRISSIPTDGTPGNLEDLISEFHVFVDVSSMLPVKTLSFDLSLGAMQNRVPIETYYSNYQSMDGILVPFHITRYLRGQKQADIVLTSVQLNVGVSDTDFQ